LKAVQLGFQDAGLADDRYSLVVEDDGAEPRRSVDAMSKLLDVDKALYVIGPFASGSTLAVVPRVRESEALLISPASTAPSLSGIAPNVFRTCPSDTEEAKVVAHAIRERSIKSVAVLYIRNEYGEQLRRTFEEEMERSGVKVQMVDSFAAGSKDFRALATKATRSGADAVYLIGYDELSGLITSLVERGDASKQRVFTNVMINNPQILGRLRNCESCGKWKVEYPVWASADPEQKSAIAGLEARLGEQSDPFAINSYNAARIIASMLKDQPANSSFAQRLAGMRARSFPGLLGEVHFDQKGDVSLPVRMVGVF
jgi:branched-chain amino acid transport system substrate-binding protein